MDLIKRRENERFGQCGFKAFQQRFEMEDSERALDHFACGRSFFFFFSLGGGGFFWHPVAWNVSHCVQIQLMMGDKETEKAFCRGACCAGG